jgi:hypothetical protein
VAQPVVPSSLKSWPNVASRDCIAMEELETAGP